MSNKPRSKRRKTTGSRSSSTSGSVVKAEYRDRYRDGSCGDDRVVRMREAVKRDDGTVDLARLQRLAQANGVWSDRWTALNPGLQRMACGNALRALVRHGGKVNWGRRGRS